MSGHSSHKKRNAAAAGTTLLSRSEGPRCNLMRQMLPPKGAAFAVVNDSCAE